MEPRLPASALPTLRQLQFLAALKAHGGFVRAAEVVGVTQPTLSAGVKELEATLGVTLVDRAKGGATLTPAGEEAAARATQILSETEELVRALAGAGGPLVGPFRLGAIPTIAPFLLPKVLPVLLADYPRLRLTLKEDLTARLLEAVRGRALDAALIALPFDAAGCEVEVIAEDEFYFVGPIGHPLCDRNDLAPEHLAGEEVLLLDDGHCLREHAGSLCRITPGRQGADVGATSLHTLVQMVAGGMGVTLAPKLAVDGGVAAGAAVALRPFAAPVIGRSIGIAWRAQGPRAAEARLLAAAIRAALTTSANRGV